MKEEEVKSLIEIRSSLIEEFSRLRDYKNNKNAIMKEIDCARVLHDTIKKIDSLLEGKVEFR